MLPADVFHGVIVVSLPCAVYRWGTFIEAELVHGHIIERQLLVGREFYGLFKL
jgi:hypothetical protein